MDDFRRFPRGDTRQIVDYNRFMSLTGSKVFLCLDKGIVETAKYLLNTRGIWRTTYVKEYVGTIGYTMPTEAEFQNVLNAIAEANEDMTTGCDDIVSALNGIKGAIEVGSAAFGGCGCVGDGSTDVTDVNDGTGSEVPSGGSYPPGFGSRGEYDTYRCQAAYYLIENYIQTLRNWAGLSGMVGGLTLAVITGLLLLTVPPAGLMIILAALGILVGLDLGLLTTLSDIADGLQGQIDEIACNVYNAASSSDAAQVIRDAASGVIDDLSIELSATYKQITDNLISNNQADVLTSQAEYVSDIGERDCSSCGGDVWLKLFDPLEAGDTGSLDETSPGVYSFAATFNAGRYAVCITVVQGPEGEEVNACAYLNFTVTGDTHTGYPDAVYFCGNSEYDVVAEPGSIEVYNDDTCIGGVILQSDTDFSGTVTVVGTCE